MPQKENDRNFETAFNKMLDNWKNANLTLKEGSELLGVNLELIRILCDPENTIVHDISIMLENSNIRLTSSSKPIKTHDHYTQHGQIKMFRKMEPRASIIYDMKKDDWFDFKFLDPKAKVDYFAKQRILGEFVSYKQNFIDKINREN